MTSTEINKNNFSDAFQHILNKAENSLFIAIDCEFSGIGEINSIRSKDQGTRYQAYKNIAQTHSLIEFGLSLFEESPTGYHVTIFNLLLMNQEIFSVTPSSLEFLVEHGFDFNKLFVQGIPFIPGNSDVEQGEVDEKKIMLVREFFRTLINLNKKLVFHNGLLDLLFLYQSFIGELPKTLEEFRQELKETFPIIVDTKWIADKHTDERPTRLDVLFNSLQAQAKEISEKNGNSYSVIYTTHKFTFIDKQNNLIDSKNTDDEKINLKKRSLEEGELEEPSNKKRKLLNNENEKYDIKHEVLNNNETNDTEVNFQSHNAGWDSWATGYIYSSLLQQFNQEDVSNFDNKVFLMGTNTPFDLSL